MTPLDSLLVHIFSLACFQGKASRDFSLFVGPNTLLEWREFLSVLKTIFKKFTSNARRSHFDCLHKNAWKSSLWTKGNDTVFVF